MSEDALEEDGVETHLVARILRRLRPRGGKLLEFGCRDGQLLRQLSEHFEAFGYEHSAAERSRCRFAAPEAVILEEWESTPAESFDVIVSVAGLARLKRPAPVVEALAVRLRPGGVLLLVVPNPGGFGRILKGERWFAHPDRANCNRLSRGEWVMLARRAGLQVAWVRGDGMWDVPYFDVVPLAVQRVLFGLPEALERISPLSRPLMPPMFGESLVIAATKPASGASGAGRPA